MSSVVSIIQKLEEKQLRAATGKAAHPDFRVGDTVRVGVLIKEGEKEREQAFEGVVISRTNNGSRASFTVRKVSYGVGVERVFPAHSPRVAQIEVISRGKVRRGRLFYLRDLAGKAARIKERHGIRTELVAAPAQQPDTEPSNS